MLLITPNHIESNTGRLLYLETASDQSAESGKYLCRAGDVVYSKIRPSLRKVCIAPQDCLCSADMYPLRSHSGLTNSFLYWLMLTEEFSAFAVLESERVAMPKINRESLKAVSFACPAVREQFAISIFLGRETAKIDALVAEQRRLIELLKEKRQAVISHAVTKGLNPDAPMKPSGIEWLGDLPEDWKVEQLKHCITRIEQGWSPQCDNEPALEGEWGVLKVGCGNRNEFDPNEQKALPIEVSPLVEYEIRPGDILMSRGNTRDLVGMATLVKQVRPKLLLCDLLYRFHARPEFVIPEFLVHSLRSAYLRYQIERDATGTSASMKKIGQETIREFLICRPPISEQKQIIVHINNETTKIDTLTAEAQRAIDLLQERRTALISAAVTGKIDVRGLVNDEEEAA
ncbi:restriction endonuclease subunit S [Singulisphaera sp. PoT]|uniref:restriction endonuclease subunit S n=1 Tax=Singulisphaera sp. PoT TaxID=3411797 RepID=UPI003BF58771